MHPTPPHQPTALITGASGGIGAATARLLAAHGYRVAVSARRESRLNALRDELHARHCTVETVPADLCRAEEPARLFDEVLARFGRVDLLVNNAGYGMQKAFTDTTDEDIRCMYAVNIIAPMILSRLAVKHMLAQGGGAIVNIASVAGFMPHPLNALYSATKHALIGFSRSLRLELKGSGVTVCTVCPGATQTEFFDVALRDIPFNDLIERFSAPPETVARAVLRAAAGTRAMIFPTWPALGMYLAEKFAPWLAEFGNLRYRDDVLKAAGKK